MKRGMEIIVNGERVALWLFDTDALLVAPDRQGDEYGLFEDYEVLDVKRIYPND